MPRWLTLNFCGLVFRIDSDERAKHKGKRIKVSFKRERESVFDIETGQILKGELSNRPLESAEIRDAQEIIKMKKSELLKAWDELKAGQLFERHAMGDKKELAKWLEK